MLVEGICDSNLLQACKYVCFQRFPFIPVSDQVEPFEILDGDGEFAKATVRSWAEPQEQSEVWKLISGFRLSKQCTMITQATNNVFLWDCGEHSKIFFWALMQEKTQSWSPSIDRGRQLNPAARTSTLVHLEIPTSGSSCLHQSRKVEELCLCSDPVRYNRRHSETATQ